MLQVDGPIQFASHGANQSRISSNACEEEAQSVMIKQGETIKTDLAIQGNKIFSDAAWKTKKVPGSQGRVHTGLGVYCQIQQSQLMATILIQASTDKAPSPLHAEALALLLAATIADRLQASQVTFLTDNLILSRATAVVKTTDPRVPWEIREQIANYKQVSRGLQTQVYHIKRNINGVTHNCAHQAIRQSQSLPIFSCSSSAHRQGNCPIALALQNFYLQGIVMHAVNCI
jgi:hypothetical protein